MKIELEDLPLDEGCLLRLGNVSLMFNSRLEAQAFVDRLQGRIDASMPGQEVEQGADQQGDSPS
jgi:hypothetical protein